MKLLISVKNRKEAAAAIEGGADIIDVKNPDEGSLGAGFPWVIKEIKEVVPENLEISAAIGDIEMPGTASLAAYGAASLGLDYIKVGLRTSIEDISKAVTKAVKERSPKTKVILVGYADFSRINSSTPDEILNSAINSGAQGVMLDTFIKDGNSLLNFLSLEELELFVKKAHSHSLLVGLAGSLKKEDLEKVAELKPDVIGIRGSACMENDRKKEIKIEKVQELKAVVGNYI